MNGPADERGSVKGWVIAFAVAFPLAFGALIGAGCALGANACPFGDGAAVTTTDGRELFLSQCALCHGIEAAGSAQNRHAPALIFGPSSELPLDRLIAEIEDGSPGLMPRFEGKLSDEQIRAVAGYVIALREGRDD